MSGKGKNTKYVPPKSARRSYMERIFVGSPFATLDEEQAAAQLSKQGNEILVPPLQQGEPGHFPQGVRLDYKHPNAPDLSTVKWGKAGDPATAYFPDLVSPGAGPEGQINLSPNDVDPEIGIDDVKPNYVPGAIGTAANGGTGTVSPVETAAKISNNNELGKDLPLGSSQKQSG